MKRIIVPAIVVPVRQTKAYSSCSASCNTLNLRAQLLQRYVVSGKPLIQQFVSTFHGQHLEYPR